MTPNFRIKSGANSYMVDLDIISSASEYFRSASQFGTEASEGVITLHDDAPAMVDMMVEFLQNANYHPAAWKPDTDSESLVWIRTCGINPYICRESTDRYGPLSGGGVSIALSTHSSPNSGVPPPSNSNKRALSTLDDIQPDNVSHKRQRVAPSIPKGSGFALYHTPTPRHMLLHLQLWEVADKYLVPDLQALCTRRFKEAAEYYHSHPEMIDAILFVYENLSESAKDLRKIIVSIVYDSPILLEDAEIQESIFYQELCNVVVSLANGRTDRPDPFGGKSQCFQRSNWPHVS
ncbi:unnamed protein product [Alternaria alternata]